MDVPLVDELVARGGEAMVLEDYCHAVEHSIEFQVVFLQHVLGPDVRILPVLCGPFAGATRDGPRTTRGSRASSTPSGIWPRRRATGCCGSSVSTWRT